jgi:hypothetical protein
MGVIKLQIRIIILITAIPRRRKLINHFVIKISVDDFLLALNSSSDTTQVQVSQPNQANKRNLFFVKKDLCTRTEVQAKIAAFC